MLKLKKYFKTLNIKEHKGYLIILIILLSIIIITIIKTFTNSNYIINDNSDTLLGIDVSHYQKNPNWQSIIESNISFVFLKATEGYEFVDEDFQSNWGNTKKNHLLRGAYHFFSPDKDGLKQSKNFIKTVPKEKFTLAPVLDIETKGKNQKYTIDQLKIYLENVEKHYGIKPIIYTNYTIYNSYIKGNFENYPLWYAQYSQKPYLDKEKWEFWQYTEKGTIKGINGKVDLNIYDGNKDDLKKLITNN